MDPTTILIADARVLVRNGIKALVNSLLGEVQFLEVHDGDSLLHAAGWPKLRFGLVDPDMPRMEGGRRLIEFARRHPQLPLVVVASFSSPDVIRRMASIPTVCAFVPVSASIERVRLAIEAAMQGRKLTLASADQGSVPQATALTPRQQEIRRLLRTGMSNKSIAGALGISESTVKNHISEIFKTLKATNRMQAAQISSEGE